MNEILRGIPLVACLLACGVITGVGAVVNVARVSPGSSVAVVGAGGVGLNAIQGAALAGAGRIVAVDQSEAQTRAPSGRPTGCWRVRAPARRSGR